MPRIFNRIRKQLAIDNKFFQYSRYAIGEILLVVIGILIALQIDTWNNAYIDAQKEKEYLRNLIEDLNTQKNLVNSQIDHEARMRSMCESALKQLNSRTINIDSLNTNLVGVTRKTFVVHDPTFQDLKSSGNILLIKNNELRKKTLAFYQFLEYSALVLQTSNETDIADYVNFIGQKRVINMNYQDSLTVAGGVDFNLNTVDIPWANDLLRESYRDRKHLLMVLNQIAGRGRTSTVHLDIMKRLKQRIGQLQQDILNYIEL